VHDCTSWFPEPKRTTKRPSGSVVLFCSDIHLTNKLSFLVKGIPGQPEQTFDMKYTYQISQWDVYTQCYMVIFCDLDAEAFEQHSTMASWWLTHHYAPLEYVSPARRSRRLHFNVYLGDPFLHPNALKYVLCAINRAKRGKKISLELPKDFIMSVQVHQVLIFLQVEECIDPMHGHIRQIIRQRPLSPVEFDALWTCLGNVAPRIYDSALSMYFEHQKYRWSLEPVVEDTSGEMVRCDTEGAISPEEETVIGEDSEGDTRMASDDEINTDSDDAAYNAEDEDSDQAEQELATIIQQPTTFIPLRRRSVPTPYSQPLYDIDTSDFRECADEEPEY
jgi:hypothetical protein